jgi:hypothetical protein
MLGAVLLCLHREMAVGYLQLNERYKNNQKDKPFTRLVLASVAWCCSITFASLAAAPFLTYSFPI